MIRLLSFALAFLFILAWAFIPARKTDDKPAPVQQGEAHMIAVPSADKPAPIGNGMAKVTIPRAADGHFYVDAQVGPTVIHFLVDTGASTVALSREDARRAGISPVAGDFAGTAQTANGAVSVKPVTIDRIRIGPLEAQDVEGVVIDGDLRVSLLGQSWLRRVGSVTIKDDSLILN